MNGDWERLRCRPMERLPHGESILFIGGSLCANRRGFWLLTVLLVRLVALKRVTKVQAVVTIKSCHFSSLDFQI